jgi:hypothetical protein
MTQKIFRLAVLDEQLQRFDVINLRLLFGMIAILVLGSVFATSMAAWWFVRKDLGEYSAALTDAISQRDHLMTICVMRDDATKAEVRARKTKLGIGGEGK